MLLLVIYFAQTAEQEKCNILGKIEHKAQLNELPFLRRAALDERCSPTRRPQGLCNGMIIRFLLWTKRKDTKGNKL